MLFHTLHGFFGFSALFADTGHDAHALRLDENLSLFALLAADRLTEGVICAAEPLAVPAGIQHSFLHLFHMGEGGFRFFNQAKMAAKFRIGAAVFHKHTGYEHTLGNGAFTRSCHLEAFARVFGEAVEIEAVIPVSPADQRELMRSQMPDRVVEAAAEMLHQRLRQ